MSQQSVITEYVEITPGVLGGKPRIAGHRISVAQIAEMYLKMGESIEEIARDYNLSPASVHAAMTSYYDHQEEIDRCTAVADCASNGRKWWEVVVRTLFRRCTLRVYNQTFCRSYVSRADRSIQQRDYLGIIVRNGIYVVDRVVRGIVHVCRTFVTCEKCPTAIKFVVGSRPIHIADGSTVYCNTVARDGPSMAYSQLLDLFG